MSHTTAIDSIVFSDIDALTAAVNELISQGVKCSLEKDAVPRAFYQNQSGLGKAPYVLRLHDSRYDIGFYPREGRPGMEARTDLFGGDVRAVLGARTKTNDETAQQAALGRLNQAYAIHAATRAATKKGMAVRRINGEDGSVRLVVTGYN
jgi:hypothetical protein